MKIVKALLLVTNFMLFCMLLISCRGEEFHLEEKKSGDIVYYLAEHKECDDEPVIVLCHGLGGNHEDMQSAAAGFYGAGYAVVTLDLYGHEGNVYDSDVYIHEMLEGSKNKIEMILGALQEERSCNAACFGLYGTSLGGMVSFYMGAYGNVLPQIIISIASSPDIEDVFERALYYVPSKWSAKEGRFGYVSQEEQEGLIQWATSHNPIGNMDRLAQISVVMVNGTEDQFMSIDNVRGFKSEMEGRGAYIQVFENEHGKHDDLGDYHGEEIIKILGERLPL